MIRKLDIHEESTYITNCTFITDQRNRTTIIMGGQDLFPQEYVCQLPEAVKKTALEELREDDNIREQSLQQMRDWINKHPNIKRCRTGKEN